MIPVIRPHLPPLRAYLRYLKKIWASGRLTNNGPFVDELERKMARYLGVNDVVAVANGTLALQLTLNALDLKGEVVTTPFTFAATTNAIVWQGLRPVFADIDPRTFNLDPKDVEAKITKKTSAILAVHLYGNPCDVKRLQQVAARHRIKLIYDAAHAFGARCGGKSVLAFGDVSTLSLHATKVLHTIEGGAIVPKSRALAKKLRLLRNFGLQGEKVLFPGINAKMHEFEAAMGLLNLREIGPNIELRRERYKLYRRLLGGTSDIAFQEIVASHYNYAYMPVSFRTSALRERVKKTLIKKGVEAREYFFFPLRRGDSYLRTQARLPVARSLAERILCLPLYPALPLAQVARIARLIRTCL